MSVQPFEVTSSLATDAVLPAVGRLAPAAAPLPLPRVMLCDLDGTLIDSMPTLADLATDVMERMYGTPRRSLAARQGLFRERQRVDQGVRQGAGQAPRLKHEIGADPGSWPGIAAPIKRLEARARYPTHCRRPRCCSTTRSSRYRP
jgi:beta-phosphoglucomutase-like phosphatase (HAD superfamily)